MSVTRSLRDWLCYLEETGFLKRVRREVDPTYELCAVAKKLDGRAAVLFEKVRGYSVPVVANPYCTRELLAQTLGTDVPGIVPRFLAALSRPLPCRQVARTDAPVKENVRTRDIDLAGILPVPVHHEKDGGRYITAGVLVARHPETGVRNLSIHRLQVSGPNRLGILILPRHLWYFFQAAERAGKPLEVAIAIGVDPITALASQALTPPGVDELEIASALRGEPLELVECETVGL
ncbi:MAG: UbiD family decarboxylase, partial [Bacillota bacterium]